MQELQKILKIWLAKNEIDTDLKFYTIEDWRKRNELYHNDSEFVIITEGGLHFALNYDYGTELTDEFEDLVSSFGYYYEIGNTWNIGFYKISNEQLIRKSRSYNESLKDEKWIVKRNFIVDKANAICEDCGKKNVPFDVHHCYYIYGLEPWQYPYDSLRCLCRECHIKRGKIEKIFRANVANLKWQEIEMLDTGVKNGIYWFDRQFFFDFIKKVGPEIDSLSTLFEKLIKSKK
jgi:hypothetical protein